LQVSYFPHTALLLAPWAVLRHALKLPRGKSETAFIIATRAGTWPGFLLPGLSAGAMFIVALILLCKGYRINGIRGLDMPSNRISLHCGVLGYFEKIRAEDN
jgi:hypothetical protein